MMNKGKLGTWARIELDSKEVVFVSLANTVRINSKTQGQAVDASRRVKPLAARAVIEKRGARDRWACSPDQRQSRHTGPYSRRSSFERQAMSSIALHLPG